jgi:SAM-dependent methyltransferase
MRHFDMKNDWDVRAGENAHKAIACDDAQNEAAFRASGERDVQLVLEGVPEILEAHQSALEIGCGTGRLLEPLSRHFDQVFGVDVSGEMVRRGQERLAHLPQVHFVETDGLGKLPFRDASFDFCFSYITFHHIPIKSVVRSYINETYRVVKAAGVARWHFFGRPAGILSSLRESVTHKDTWRGYKFTLPEVTTAVRAAGFEIVHAHYVPAQSWRLFGKTPPDIIWITARKPGESPTDSSSPPRKAPG